MNKLYSVHDHWTDINKKNDVDIESIDGVITGIKVNGEDYGGSEWQNIFDNTITTVLDSDGFYSTNIGVAIEADSIRVTFDGVEYNCPKRHITEINANLYGAPTPLETGEEGFDWTDFPFSIVRWNGNIPATTVVTTQTAGSHSLKIDIPQSGSGESGFSTAKLTYQAVGQVTTPPIYISRIWDNAITAIIPVIGTYDVVLYNGVAYGILDSNDNVSVDGAIEYDDGDLVITGDCTITISALE